MGQLRGGELGVYPRLCGGTRGLCEVGPAAPGLSPPVRGNHGSQPRVQGRPGSIPACAGEPESETCPEWRPLVYPRLCGGTYDSGGAAHPGSGLSPPVRGNRFIRYDGGAFLRSIPACAGEPVRGKECVIVPEVYPRLCGGTGRPKPAAWRISGLSPPVRGNHKPCDCTSASKMVYPRLCGGTEIFDHRLGTSRGLSPPVRGNPLTRSPKNTATRSIPACAGEPTALGYRPCCRPVYPRLCGGTTPAWLTPLAQGGLSPPVRGNPGQGFDAPGIGRSIPACAGEPARRW